MNEDLGADTGPIGEIIYHRWLGNVLGTVGAPQAFSVGISRASLSLSIAQLTYLSIILDPAICQVIDSVASLVV